MGGPKGISYSKSLYEKLQSVASIGIEGMFCGKDRFSEPVQGK
jgi:hypothetical protein